MARFIVVVIFSLAISILYSLRSYLSVGVSNERFEFAKAEKAFNEKQEYIQTLKDLEHAPEEAPAQEEEAPAEEVFQVSLDSEELKRGHEIYTKSGRCTMCHGKLGQGKKSQKAPMVGGQFAWYLTKQLVEMKAGKRVNKVMNPYLKKLNTQDMKDVSAYMAKLPWKR